MSQEKTSVPGMENSYYANKKNNMYSRTTTPDMGSRGTMVPGMEEVAPNVGRHESSAKGGAPVVGFLYSISRQGIGEYWPLHIGSNKIGRSGNCDICLKEGTVSDIHAELNIKQMKTTHKILASIKDIGSKNGIFVNEEELDYSAHECFNNDLITIGLNYRLLLILIDTQALGLTVSENYNPQIQISAESETKRSIFREKDKTKRSKKESAQHSKSRNKSFVMTSVSAL